MTITTQCAKVVVTLECSLKKKTTLKGRGKYPHRDLNSGFLGETTCNLPDEPLRRLMCGSVPDDHNNPISSWASSLTGSTGSPSSAYDIDGKQRPC
ncbi:unnamed protein product [Protopolystoma xenopodis]|uniref:Uncharacterized protein n=1 Tax=Protopolystoma xenopodis TaxID=117903 RepID=A0A3S5AUC5_9PLAT|nr:unnamed protein product [Protopolystoma xenopodis]